MLTHGVFYKNTLQRGFTSYHEAAQYIKTWATTLAAKYFTVRELTDAERALFSA
jgi:hypothetical protein